MKLVSTASLLTAALLCASAASPLMAQEATVTIPPNIRKIQPPEPWEKIPVPPLPAFHPQQPKRIELKNGLVILLEPDHELPFINGAINIRGGSRDLPANKAGLIDLYGQAWRTSGTAKQSGDALDDLLASKAASVETDGDIDSTSVSWSCFTKDEKQVFGIAVDLLEHPTFSEAKLRLAQQQEIAGIVRRNDSAQGVAGREAAKLVYGKNSPYARQPEIATVMGITLADLNAWHTKTIVPNNMIVSVVGDFDPVAMEKSLRQALGGLPRGPAWPKPSGEFAGPKPGVYAVNKSDVDQSSIWILGLGTTRRNPDYYALAVMNDIFSGGFGSRLFQDVRTKQGLAYAVFGNYGASFDHPGIFYTIAMTKSATTVKTTEAMLKEIHELKTKPFTASELASAKDQLLNSFIFHFDSKDKVLAEATQLEFYGYPADYLTRYRAGIEAVTLADLKRVADKYIEPSKLAILVVGNEAHYGTPLPALNLGPVHPLDITIPMPAAMRRQMSGQGGSS
ncbi:MAG TPA: pitrilysin family protein [Acidobacteriaceae bacterium]|nr:pitrilysin family protein [Acidobacteriaceae bacterium]